jgi:hypothetical protein
MEPLDQVRRILIYRQRSDLANLLKQATSEFNVSGSYGSHLFSQLTTVEIYAPIQDYEVLKTLSETDKDLIYKAFIEVNPPKDYGIEISKIEFYMSTDSLDIDSPTNEDLVKEIEAQKNLLISVSTGGPRIDAVNNEYKKRRERIRKALQSRHLIDPNPYIDLWAWYGKWSSGDLPSYKSRRKHITDLYELLLTQLLNSSAPKTSGIFDEPTGWVRVDRGLNEIRNRLADAKTEEQYQTIGLLCREVLISLAQIVYNPSMHPTLDGVNPSDTDYKRMIEAYLAQELSGSSNEVARKHAKASFDFANDLQHHRTASFRDAALCAEATTSAVNIIAIISGQRNP